MKYTITYKDGEKEVIRAASIAEAKNLQFFFITCVMAVERSLMEKYIVNIKVGI